jgi:hypothetical protein
MAGDHRIGAHPNGEHRVQFKFPGPDPVSPMGKIPPGRDINAARQLPPRALGDDMALRSGVQRDQLATGHRCGGSTQFELQNQPSGRATDGL